MIAPEPVPRPRRRVWLILAALLTAAAVGGAWLARPRLSDDELRLVGVWMCPEPSAADNVRVIELRHNQSIRSRILDARTGAVVVDHGVGRWCASDDRFYTVDRRPWSLRDLTLGESRVIKPGSRITWDGPDRFRLGQPVEDARVWVRCESVQSNP